MLGTYPTMAIVAEGNAYRVATMRMFVDICIKSLID